MVGNPFDAHSAKAFSSQVIRKGATGDDVVELQARLQWIGYYKEKIDGKFGWGTYWALRNFQSAYGLPIDGLAGPKTKQVLSDHSSYNQAWVMGNLNKGLTFTYYGGTPLSQQVKGSSGTSSSSASTSTAQSSNLPTGYSENDIKLLSNAVYGESRGEPFEGQVAVAAVILNRVKSSKFPDTVSGVIFQPGAFTAVQDGQIWLTPNDTARKAVLDAINGWDPSLGALYYFNPDTATSSWIWGRPQILKIGKHIFTK
ncbi:spore cortex-lytic enzyme [Pullulanibacillus sp. KACC 23026]|uniref:spore cortex-lytic enzyme n=1 Tax=Pullulanibacillus sp. KACC 23026 TaxID=3028315 RepID=UPI0023B05D19|nr:spore cortex-lytic enzyme [Pullulanibacillus sp. KACC 23026]WEG14979.1 spore cortex-lytic enzyme [Pullulanibacillus sp. KACC 23026]